MAAILEPHTDTWHSKSIIVHGVLDFWWLWSGLSNSDGYGRAMRRPVHCACAGWDYLETIMYALKSFRARVRVTLILPAYVLNLRKVYDLNLRSIPRRPFSTSLSITFYSADAHETTWSDSCARGLSWPTTFLIHPLYKDLWRLACLLPYFGLLHPDM